MKIARTPMAASIFTTHFTIYFFIPETSGTSLERAALLEYMYVENVDRCQIGYLHEKCRGRVEIIGILKERKKDPSSFTASAVPRLTFWQMPKGMTDILKTGQWWKTFPMFVGHSECDMQPNFCCNLLRTCSPGDEKFVLADVGCEKQSDRQTYRQTASASWLVFVFSYFFLASGRDVSSATRRWPFPRDRRGPWG